MHETKFYARTWVFWACFCMFGHLALGTGILGLMLCFGSITPADGRPRGPDEIIAMSITIPVCFFAFLTLCIASAVNLSFWQKPILIVWKEGIEMRTGGMVFHSLVLSVLGLPLLPFELCWKLFTGRMVQTQITRLPWELLHTNNDEQGSPYIFYLEVSEDGAWFERSPLSFGTDDFGVSTQTVELSLLHYANNTSDRESLPSWEQTTLQSGDCAEYRSVPGSLGGSFVV